ncbi:uncharacterized protein LODBEIA_P41290 [Lodderomyces beijingensis]|uniref:Uncharacterized protein n=1 Tax=Lodderomyces beijingensis TaxID=1775926 RepID=A0ABP0ZRT1_9ASCO
MWIYLQTNPLARANAQVGPIRGGTEIIPFSTVTKNNHEHANIYIGFLRAHLKYCGCGQVMYRPNLYILQRDPVAGTFKALYLSSSISFDIPVFGWRNRKLLCSSNAPSALIPNGISSWVVDPVTGKDVLTLTLNVADENNEIVYLYNLKSLVEELLQDAEELGGDKLGETGESAVDAERTRNDQFMDCVVRASTKFCKNYGDEMTVLVLMEKAYAAFRKKEEEKEKLRKGTQTKDTKIQVEMEKKR